jgi:hypothetical protein
MGIKLETKIVTDEINRDDNNNIEDIKRDEYVSAKVLRISNETSDSTSTVRSIQVYCYIIA